MTVDDDGEGERVVMREFKEGAVVSRYRNGGRRRELRTLKKARQRVGVSEGEGEINYAIAHLGSVLLGQRPFL